jgi:hypothetical protein
MMRIKLAFMMVLGLSLVAGCGRENNNNGGGGGGGVATTPNTYCLNQAQGAPGCQGFQNVGWNGIQPYPIGVGGFGSNFAGCNQFAGGFNGAAGGSWAPIYGANMGLGCVNMMALPYPYNTQSAWGNINWWNYPQATGFGGWGGAIGFGGGFGVGMGVGGQWGGFMRYCQINAPGTCGYGQCVPFHAGSFTGFCVGGGMW